MTDGIHIIPDDVVMGIASRELAYSCGVAAFEASASGNAGSFPVLAASGSDPATRVNIKYGTVGNQSQLGLKIGTYWPTNESNGRANHGATTLLLDPESGRPFALLNVSQLNRLRTAAADAIAVATLSRRNSKILAVVGTGKQAEAEVRAVVRHRTFAEVRIIGRSTVRAQMLASRLADIGIRISVADVETIRDADVIITVTTATEPLFSANLVKPGAHISAMGADAVGKQELGTEMLSIAKLFADNPLQSLKIGEFQRLANDERRPAILAIGDVLAGKIRGRENDDQITIFDSSGLAAQDVVIAARIAEMAIDRGLSFRVPF